MNRQIRTMRFDVRAQTAVGNYSYQGYPVNVNAQSWTLNWRPEYYADQREQKALSGRLRSRLRGYRLDGVVTWERTTDINTIAGIAGKLSFGTKRLFWTGTTNTINASTTTLNIDNGPATANTFNGMIIDFDGADTRTITNYASNVITINSAVGLSGNETLNIRTNASMPTVVRFFPEASDTNNDVVILDPDIAANLEQTIARQPVTARITGVEVKTSIPGYYLL